MDLYRILWEGSYGEWEDQDRVSLRSGMLDDPNAVARRPYIGAVHFFLGGGLDTIERKVPPRDVQIKHCISPE